MSDCRVPMPAYELADFYGLKAFAELAWAELKAIGPEDVFVYELLEERARDLGLEAE